MEFRKYNSIENSYQESFIKSIIEQGLDNGDFVVQEKVHGSNLSFITDGEKVLCAKRTDLIEENEDFYNWKLIRNKYEDKVIEIFNYLKEKDENFKLVTIFGELFGGQYPHKEVEKDTSSKVVQKGIYYSPSNDFYAFDIMINNEYYLNIDISNQLFEKYSFLYSKNLFKGSLLECLNYPNDFESKVSEWLGLPKIEKNICEGVVIKPLESKFLRLGDRVIIKNKNEKWSENKKYIDKELLKDPEEEISKEAVFLREEIYKLITENRLNNVISKIGEANKNESGKLLGLFSKDVLEEFNKNFESKFESLEKSESKAIKKFLNTQASNLISEYFNNSLS
jgi:Rnl2 family RNA ligase